KQSITRLTVAGMGQASPAVGFDLDASVLVRAPRQELLRANGLDARRHSCPEMWDRERFLAAIVTPKGAHLREIRRSLPCLTLLDRHCVHRLTFYLAVRSLVSSLGPPLRRELH